MQRRVISRVEADELYRARNDAEVTAPEKTATDAITAAARSVALTIGAKCMVVFTSLGTTVRRAAKGRPPAPIRAGQEFNVASPRGFRARVFRSKDPRFESAPRDHRPSKNQPKRVKIGRERRL